MKTSRATLLGQFTDRPAGHVHRGGDIRAVLDMLDMHEAIDRAGVEPLPLRQAEFAAYLKSEADRWGSVISAKNIKAD